MGRRNQQKSWNHNSFSGTFGQDRCSRIRIPPPPPLPPPSLSLFSPLLPSLLPSLPGINSKKANSKINNARSYPLRVNYSGFIISWFGIEGCWHAPPPPPPPSPQPLTLMANIESITETGESAIGAAGNGSHPRLRIWSQTAAMIIELKISARWLRDAGGREERFTEQISSAMIWFNSIQFKFSQTLIGCMETADAN